MLSEILATIYNRRSCQLDVGEYDENYCYYLRTRNVL